MSARLLVGHSAMLRKPSARPVQVSFTCPVADGGLPSYYKGKLMFGGNISLLLKWRKRQNSNHRSFGGFLKCSRNGSVHNFSLGVADLKLGDANVYLENCFCFLFQTSDDRESLFLLFLIRRMSASRSQVVRCVYYCILFK